MWKICALAAGIAIVGAATAPGAWAYRVVRVSHVGGKGRWDYMTLNNRGTRLYVTRQFYTMVLNSKTMKVVARIGPNHGSHGVALVPRLNRGFISNGISGTVSVFNVKTNRIIGTVKARRDADCIIYDPASRDVLAFCGDSQAMVAISADVRLPGGKASKIVHLPGKPEFAVSDGKGRVYVNLVNKHSIAVIDSRTMRVVRRINILPGEHATGLSMDVKDGLLFAGCHNKRMIIVNAHTGKIVGDVPIGGGVDATAFDGHAALASCGAGELVAVRRKANGRFVVQQVLPTQFGARTMAVDKTRGIVYLATSKLLKNPHGWPKPVPGTFRILTVRRTGGK